MKAVPDGMEAFTTKLVVCALVAVLLVLGAAGLILPIIPGIVFLALAALLAARHFPRLGAWLRRRPALGVHLERADRFFDLPAPRKLQVAALVCVKLVLDGLAFASRVAAAIVAIARGR